MSDLKINSLADLNTHPIQGFTNIGDHEFKVPLYSHIKDNLWMGGCPVGVAPVEFKFIVNLYPWGNYETPGHPIRLTARLMDSADVPNENVLRMLADFTRTAMKQGMTLVHCQAGLNRSGLVCALALIREGMDPKCAIDLLREKRCEAVLCNPDFEKFLLRAGRAT